jgi:hypothetical protein
MATIYDQQKTTYSDTGNQVRVISDVIQLIDPADTPLLDLIGGLDGARSKFSVRQNGTKIEWLEDEYMPLSSTCANTTLTSSTTLTTWDVADASIFKDGDMILIDAELMVVKAADTTGNTIIVYSRSYGGTNATHASTSTVYIVGQGRLEGDDTDYRGLVQLAVPYNYTSIYEEGLKISGTDMVIDQIGYGNPFDYQAAKRMKDLFRRIENALFYSVRAAGSATAPRTFGGLPTFITSNTVTASSAAVTKTVLDTLAETMYNNGANPDVMVCHPSTAVDLKTLLDATSYLYTESSNTYGRAPVQVVQTQFGTWRLVIDRWCPKTAAYLLDTKKIGMYTLRPFGWKPLADAGDAKKADLIGEVSLVIASDKAHGKILGITT